jgi:hypothetical protein
MGRMATRSPRMLSPTDPGPIAVGAQMQCAFTRPRAWTSDFLFPHSGGAPRSVESSATAPKLKEAETNRAPKTPVVDIAAGQIQRGGRIAPQFGRVASPEGSRFRQFSTVIGLATRGIMMIESCRVNEPTENQIPVGWNG